MHSFRTHHCGELRQQNEGQTVRLSGWVFRKRDHGHLCFYDLRDHYGLTQVVFHPDRPFFEATKRVRYESVVTITGKVVLRDAETVNPEMPTGAIEVVVDAFEIQSEADPIPLQVDIEDPGPEETRLRNRFLDLRRERMHNNIVLRSNIISSIRRRMTELGFTEFQTPILTSSSPEGARDYLVPSRLHPGHFYALPQAPQQFKQLLMVSGFDRYFQVAPCFRDEDARADRSPGEFYQLDIEMAYVEQDDVFAAVEQVLHGVFDEFSSQALDAPPYRRIPFREAMLKYGSDKPDLRIPIEIRDVTSVFAASDFRAFRGAIEKGAVVRAIPVSQIADRPRGFFDKMVEYAQSIGSKGLAYLVYTAEKVKGPIAKFLNEEQMQALKEQCEIKVGDVLFFVCEKEGEAARLAGDIRLKLGRDLEMVEPNAFRFCWIVDFPMFEWDEERKCIGFSHNPFSMPQGGLEALENKDPLEILAYQYDIVCNGIELSSGAIRNHRPDIMYKAFEMANYPPEVVDDKFGGMIRAFKLGAPPHGGIAPGIDRIVMLLAGEENIREVIAFPMNQKAQDLLMGAPCLVQPKQLRELNIRLSPGAEKALSRKEDSEG
ncbi:MAG: aspartate--tRNA ligase [Okeania sp. SIO1H5]|uniref:aspartate--tRNA ligase n=1 Tax=Okeania sp. SIO1H5 TaxID=2607777 RepID=UPI0013B60696|nr:aspartate--tRNA ligase [Okeania sp. SIO1H5]NET23752.1 aspartate--tRNA ligase [Okeania sp. SIO1H5]